VGASLEERHESRGMVKLAGEPAVLVDQLQGESLAATRAGHLHEREV